MNTIVNDNSTSHHAENFFKQYKDGFGNVISAEMKSDAENVEYELILTNDKGELMHISGGATAGYSGAGPNTTYRILKQCGFDVTEEYVHTNGNFILKK